MTDFFFQYFEGVVACQLEKGAGDRRGCKESVLLTAVRLAADSGTTPTARPTLGLLHEEN